jgi:hypothetical protein
MDSVRSLMNGASSSTTSIASTAAPVSRIVLLAPGRSGSTLLQSAFLASCNVLTFFEPCHHGAGSHQGDIVRGRCVQHVERFLDCNLPHSSSGRWDPPKIRTWFQHPYKAANTSCARAPFATVQEAHLACRSALVVLVKEIRLVGQLSRLAASLAAKSSPAHSDHSQTGRPWKPRTTAIVHLVRDPRATLASQRRLHWWRFGNISQQTRRQRAREMERVAKPLCRGMLADSLAGERLRKDAHSAIRYVAVSFEELTSDLSATIERIYSELGLLPTPGSTHDWIQRTLSGQCAHGDGALSDGHINASTLEKFEYSTCRSKQFPSSGRRNARWKHALSRLEKRAIVQHCAQAMARLGYRQ